MAQRRFNINIEKKADADSKRQVEQAKAIKADKHEDEIQSMAAASAIKVSEHAKISEIDFAHKAKEILLKGVLDESKSRMDDNELKGQKLVDTLINQYQMQMEKFINPPDAKAKAA